MKNAYYFSHDGNARNDEKILTLREEHGCQGYGIYWILIEMMFENAETSLKHKSVKAIAKFNNIKITLLESVINTCINEKLFISNGEIFWSESLQKRKESFENIKNKKSFAGKKGMESRYGNVDITALHNDVITPLYQNTNTVITEPNIVSKVSKVIKVRKGKNILPEIIIFGSQKNIKLTQTEFDSLKADYPIEYLEAIEFLSLYIAEKGDKTKSKTHYLTIRRWVIDAVKEKREKNGKQTKQKPGNVGNFEQREYPPSYWNAMYEDVSKYAKEEIK